MEWAAAGISAVLYLAWFGAYTSAKYRGLYGRLPEIQQPPTFKRNVYREPPQSLDDCCTASGSYMVSSAVGFYTPRLNLDDLASARPGSIVRLESWD